MNENTPHIFPHAATLSRADRFKSLGVTGCTLWFTGLSGSGKSTIASALEHALVTQGVWAYRLDGDTLRTGLNANLGFSAEDRAENIRRAGAAALLFADAGCITIASLISPYLRERALVRAKHAESGLTFLEVFVDAPLEVCEARDPKGLYKKARAGAIRGFTGIDDPYEPPTEAELVLRSAELSPADCVKACMDLLCMRGLLRP